MEKKKNKQKTELSSHYLQNPVIIPVVRSEIVRERQVLRKNRPANAKPPWVEKILGKEKAIYSITYSGIFHGQKSSIRYTPWASGIG